MAHNSKQPDPYKVLNLPLTSDEAQIKRSYRQLARKYHPDTWSLPCFSAAERKRASDRFAEISAAHSLLVDPRRRAEYDRHRRCGGGQHDDDNEGPSAGGGSSRDTANRQQQQHKRQQQQQQQQQQRGSSAAAPPPPPRDENAPPPLPPHWACSADPSTGRVYYYHSQTGRSSWQHPAAAVAPAPGKFFFAGDRHPGAAAADRYSRMPEEQRQQHRPDNHRCGALVALCLCPPVGLIAAYHSAQVDRCWRRGLYGEAVHHARQAPKYAGWGTALGLAFWVGYLYWIFVFREGGGDRHKFEWPDFDFKWDRRRW